ncbi:MAG: hypothetical protein NTV05_12750 [Acidobacteria bacterium]|nr:hypothetical protein [Acidobacteriota bacterium]
MFDYRRTPYLAFLYAAVIGSTVIAIVEMPARPLTLAQSVLFYALSYLPALGLSMLSDPASKRARAEYMKIDFYAPKDGTDASAAAARASRTTHVTHVTHTTRKGRMT